MIWRQYWSHFIWTEYRYCRHKKCLRLLASLNLFFVNLRSLIVILTLQDFRLGCSKRHQILGSTKLWKRWRRADSFAFIRIIVHKLESFFGEIDCVWTLNLKDTLSVSSMREEIFWADTELVISTRYLEVFYLSWGIFTIKEVHFGTWLYHWTMSLLDLPNFNLLSHYG